MQIAVEFMAQEGGGEGGIENALASNFFCFGIGPKCNE